MRKLIVRTAVLHEVFVGIDYATAFVQVCVLDRGGTVLVNRVCENNAAEIARCVARFGMRVRAAIEACTGAANLAEELLKFAGWSMDLAHPGYVQRMKQNPDKTDYGDARMLADLVRVGYLPRVWLAPEAIRELRRLVRYRTDLVNRRRVLKLQVSALLRDHRIVPPSGRSWTKRWRAWLTTVQFPPISRSIIDGRCVEFEALNSAIAAVSLQLATVTENDPVVPRLLELPGIGLITACTLRAEIGDVARFRTGKQLARFCGLTPQNASSGERVADAGLIRAGNRHLRATLIEAAHRLRRYSPRWKAFSDQLEARGKRRCVTVAAVANRWVRGLYHEMLKMTPAA